MMLAAETYALALTQSLLVFALVVAPGLCWNLIATQKLRTSTIPLPGVLFLVAAGTVIWAIGLQNGWLSTCLVAGPSMLSLLLVAARWRNASNPVEKNSSAAIAVWLSLIASSILTGINPLPIALENYAGFVFPGRMVAAQPDSMIPYSTAAYMAAGHDGKEKSDLYFGKDWNVGSRGPLAPLAILSLLRLTQAEVKDPPELRLVAWPVTYEGTYVARVFGWITNAMVVLALSRLLTALKVEGRRYYFALAWAFLAPSIVVNTEYVWPKLLAAYFILSSIAAIIEGGYVAAGAFSALAWLCHPVGVLFVPGAALACCLMCGDLSIRAASLVKFSVVVVVMVAPWAAFKLWLNAPDHFLDYLLAAGDPSQRAKNVAEWVNHRVVNTIVTLVPGLFVLLGKITNWSGVILSTPMQWNMAYTKTLPGALGYILFVPAYFFALRSQVGDLRMVQVCFIVIPFFLMIIVWGFSSDGLGRNSLEPLVPIIIAVAAARMIWSQFVQIACLLVLLCESKWVELSSFAMAQEFRLERVPNISWSLWACSAALSIFVVSWIMTSPDGGLKRS